MEELLQQVVELQKALRRLHGIRKPQKKLDRLFQAQSVADSQPTTTLPKTPSLAHREGKGANNAEEWKLATARTCRRKRLPLKPEVPLPNHFTVLQTQE